MHGFDQFTPSARKISAWAGRVPHDQADQNSDAVMGGSGALLPDRLLAPCVPCGGEGRILQRHRDRAGGPVRAFYRPCALCRGTGRSIWTGM